MKSTITPEMIEELAKTMPPVMTLCSLEFWPKGTVHGFDHDGVTYVIANPATWRDAFAILERGHTVGAPSVESYAMLAGYHGSRVLNLDKDDGERKRIMGYYADKVAEGMKE